MMVSKKDFSSCSEQYLYEQEVVLKCSSPPPEILESAIKHAVGIFHAFLFTRDIIVECSRRYFIYICTCEICTHQSLR